jgi:hypothetical protein
MSYSSAAPPDVPGVGYLDYVDKQAAEPIPRVVAVERWPEVLGGPFRLSAESWRELYRQGFASLPKDWRARLRWRRACKAA